jgi:Mg-chelatase subunit ChlD
MRFRNTLSLLLSASAAATLLSACDDGPTRQSTGQIVDSVVPPVQNVAKTDGIALAVVLDTSGSMGDRVNDGVKIDLARGCVREIVKKAENFAQTKDVPVALSVYRFDDRVANVVPLGNPSLALADSAIGGIRPGGSTAIGNAVIAATRSLNTSGYSNVHILVITDGENSAGTDPADVAAAFAKLPPQYRPNVYVVAFDVNSASFWPLKDNGWRILSAANGAELNATLDQLVGGEILLEK